MPGDMIMTRTAAVIIPAMTRSAHASKCLFQTIYAQAMSPVLSIEGFVCQDHGNLLINGSCQERTGCDAVRA